MVGAVQDLSVQRLSSCALCNVCANHEANKRQAREVGALPVLVHLLSSSQVRRAQTLQLSAQPRVVCCDCTERALCAPAAPLRP